MDGPRRMDPAFRTKVEPHLTADLLRQGWHKAKDVAPEWLRGGMQSAEDWGERTSARGAAEELLRSFTPGEPWEVPLMGLGKAPKLAAAASAALAGGDAEAGPLSFLLRGGKTAARSASKLGAHGLNVPGFHWSHETNLLGTEPLFYGKGIKGEEAARLADAPDVKPRSYFYTDEMRKEPGLGRHQYTGELEHVYPLTTDPAGYRKLAKESGGNVNTEVERLIKKGGYKGYVSDPDQAAVMFERVPVRPHTQGTMPQPPKPPKPTITDTTEVAPGTRTGMVVTPEGAAERMKWLEADRTYEKLGMTPESLTGAGYYPNPHTGVVERNPLRMESVPYTPANEQAVDTYGTVRNVMLGQNARAYGGVADDGAGGLRISLSGQTHPQVEDVLGRLNTEGSYAAPGGRDTINFGRFDENSDEAVAQAYEALKAAKVPHAAAHSGGARSGYDEFDWSQPGSGQLTTQHIMPRLLRDPDLVKRMDLTGEPGQFAKGLLAAARKDALRAGSVGREDVQMLNSKIAEGGLGGLVDWVQKHGAKGLPALGGAAVLPALLREDRPEAQ